MPSRRDPIITRFRAKDMSTNDPSAFEVSVVEFMQMKEQMAEMMRMMQQLVVGCLTPSYNFKHDMKVSVTCQVFALILHHYRNSP